MGKNTLLNFINSQGIFRLSVDKQVSFRPFYVLLCIIKTGNTIFYTLSQQIPDWILPRGTCTDLEGKKNKNKKIKRRSYHGLVLAAGKNRGFGK